MSVGTGNAVKGNWKNADGLPVYFPQHYVDAAQRTNKPTGDKSFGVTRQIVIPFDLSKLAASTTSYTTDLDNDGTTDGFTEHDPHIPANSTVTKCVAYVTTTAVGGTSITVGAYKADGTIVSANGFLTATEGVTANLVKGQGIVGNGTLCNTSSQVIPVVAATNTWPAIVTAGTFTAGAGFIVLDYVDLAANPELSTNN